MTCRQGVLRQQVCDMYVHTSLQWCLYSTTVECGAFKTERGKERERERERERKREKEREREREREREFYNY